MNNIINQMLSKYEIKNVNDEINALKEIIQEVVLSGLSRSNFFNNVAFCDETALRIFYNLDRFSEDLDFALISPNKNFEANIASAFLKGDTLEHILRFFSKEDNQYNKLLKDIKIKFEVDINPPIGANYEMKYKLLPSPHQVNLYDASSLFAGKVHAILCRNYHSRVKGRDLYDYVFFLANNVKINITLLKNKLIASNFIKEDEQFDINILKDMLIKKFNEIDYEEAKKDVIPFIKNNQSLDLWNKEFFAEITKNLN